MDAAIWGVPIVSVHAMRQAFFREAQANYNDILHWSKPSDWKTTLPPPRARPTRTSTSTPRMVPSWWTSLRPLKLGLFGNIMGAWQAPLVNVGPEGDDQGSVLFFS